MKRHTRQQIEQFARQSTTATILARRDKVREIARNSADPELRRLAAFANQLFTDELGEKVKDRRAVKGDDSLGQLLKKFGSHQAS